jgi:hypothetical protein
MKKSISPVNISQLPSLSISYFFVSENNIPSLQLNFCFDKSPYEKGNEEAQKKAATDVEIYLTAFDFFMSPGKKMSYCTSMDGNFPNLEGTKRTIDISLFVEQLLNPIIGFLKNCAEPKNQTVLAPIPFPYTLQSEIKPSSIETYSDLFQLTVSVIVEADQSENSIKKMDPIVTPIDPQLSLSPCDKIDNHSLQTFAAQFETVFNNQPEKGNSFKIASGLLQQKANGNFSFPIWVMHFDENGKQGIHFAADTTNSIYYAPLPLSNHLLTFKSPIYHYQTGEIFPLGEPTQADFYSADPDNWNQTALAAIDKFLLPVYSNAASLLDGGKAIQQITTAKQIIAAALSQNVAAISGTDNATALANAKENWKQHLSQQLSNAYKTSALIQSPFSINSCWKKPGSITPSLTGKITGTNSLATNEDFLSNGNLLLQNGTSYLSYFFDSASPETYRNFSFSNVNFSINSLKLNDGKSNSPMVFAFPPAICSSANVNIPIPIRVSPPISLAVSQNLEYAATSENPSVAQARKWKYIFGYQIDPASVVQDTYKLQLNLNVPDASEKPQLKIPPYSFSPAQALAQFIAVYPGISADLDKYLLAVNEVTVNNNSIGIYNARCVVQAFTEITKAFSESWANFSPTKNIVKENAIATNIVYTIIESEENINGNLLISVVPNSDGDLLSGTSVAIPGYMAIQDKVMKNVYRYSDDKGNFLSFANRTENVSRIFSPSSPFDILSEENVFPILTILRNEDLNGDEFHGWSESNPEFIYATHQISPPQKLSPFLVYNSDIDIATISSVNYPPQPKRILQNQMRAMLEALTENVSEENISFKAAISYSYKESGVEFNLPVTLCQQTEINVGDKGQFFADQLCEAITLWQQNANPETLEGKYLFQVEIFSSINPAIPKLQLSLFLKLVNLEA